ncbi:hypothetical protein DWB61_07445 [Ancylomarina euxinus]|uniref:Uncharacterized protein n=1 Tax=Ancylomarina euxinus TaxID=2283627 RepID=A0A425Y3C0_9BACT|nr:hypothetical protein [Ancylomarina euxinus]MCZ4693094.1 hypothetical protein [Ancylomarina euxinus]MUP15230.1 hypothetical protein [Ancylomarina euxinus]RRG22640.1 hypothetical protein DWB61_07445 [Ancylomarina euxinus]
MASFSTFKLIYFIGLALIFIGGYRLYNHLSYGNIIISVGLLTYAIVQLYLLIKQGISNWGLFEYTKTTVNVLFICSVILLMGLESKGWFYPLILGMLLDFFANIFRRVNRS